MRECY